MLFVSLPYIVATCLNRFPYFPVRRYCIVPMLFIGFNVSSCLFHAFHKQVSSSFLYLSCVCVCVCVFCARPMRCRCFSHSFSCLLQAFLMFFLCYSYFVPLLPQVFPLFSLCVLCSFLMLLPERTHRYGKTPGMAFSPEPQGSKAVQPQANFRISCARLTGNPQEGRYKALGL
jgi:hypothetical protein